MKRLIGRLCIVCSEAVSKKAIAETLTKIVLLFIYPDLKMKLWE